MISYGFYAVSMLPSLGWREQEKVWNDAKSIYEYQAGDNSQLILLYGVALNPDNSLSPPLRRAL